MTYARPHAPEWWRCPARAGAAVLVERHAAGADAEREQAADGELGAERAGEPPSAAGRADARRRSTPRARRRRARAGAARSPALRSCAASGSCSGSSSAAAPARCRRASAGGQRPMKQRWHGWERGGEAAQGEHVGAARGARVAVQQRRAGSARRAGRGRRRRARASAIPAARTTRRRRSSARARPSWRRRREAGAAPLHELAHARLADAHPRGRVGAREALQVAQRRRLLLARAQARAQRLEQLAQPRAIVELGGEVAARSRCRRASAARRRRAAARSCARRCSSIARRWVTRRATRRDWRSRCRRARPRRGPARPGRRRRRDRCGRASRRLPADVRRRLAMTRSRSRLELLAQQTIGAVATKDERAHRSKTTDSPKSSEAESVGQVVYALSTPP